MIMDVCIVSRYIKDSWNTVSQEAERNNGRTMYYEEDKDSRNLKDFEPFNLEAFWGQRIVHMQHVQNS